eukprot:2504196-Rhodomonas_salina.1
MLSEFRCDRPYQPMNARGWPPDAHSRCPRGTSAEVLMRFRSGAACCAGQHDGRIRAEFRGDDCAPLRWEHLSTCMAIRRDHVPREEKTESDLFAISRFPRCFSGRLFLFPTLGSACRTFWLMYEVSVLRGRKSPTCNGPLLCRRGAVSALRMKSCSGIVES